MAAAAAAAFSTQPLPVAFAEEEEEAEAAALPLLPPSHLKLTQALHLLCPRFFFTSVDTGMTSDF